MSTEKQKYKPLHERLQSSDLDNKALLEHLDTQKKELNDIYKAVFETKQGQLVLNHLVETYIAGTPAPNATPNEIMYQHGRAFVIKDIINRIKRTE